MPPCFHGNQPPTVFSCGTVAACESSFPAASRPLCWRLSSSSSFSYSSCSSSSLPPPFLPLLLLLLVSFSSSFFLFFFICSFLFFMSFFLRYCLCGFLRQRFFIFSGRSPLHSHAILHVNGCAALLTSFSPKTPPKGTNWQL